MSNDTKWTVGTAMVLAGLLSAQIAGVNARIGDLRADLTAQLSAQIAGVNARIDDLRADLTARIDRIETRLDGFGERLRNVEIEFGKVDQRLLTIERVILPARDQPDR